MTSTDTKNRTMIVSPLLAGAMASLEFTLTSGLATLIGIKSLGLSPFQRGNCDILRRVKMLRFAFGVWLCCVYLVQGNGQSASAALLAYEPFGGGADNTQLDTSAATGTGFGVNTWQDVGGHTRHINRNAWAPQFPVNSPFTSPNFLMVEMLPDSFAQSQSSRNLSGVSIDLSQDGQYYMSFTSRVFNNDTWSSVSLHDSNTGNLGVAVGHRWGGNNAAGNPYQISGPLAAGGAPLFNTGNFTAGVADQAHASGENLFYVAKIVASAAGTDQVFLKVYANGVDTIHEDPNVLSGEGPGVNNWSVISTGGSSSLVLDQLRVAHSGQGFAQVDEIRIGRSWLDVTGVAIPEPSALALGAIGLSWLVLIGWRRRRR